MGTELDADDFAERVVGHYGRVVRAVTVVCGDAGVAEDAVQEALVRAWLRLERGDELRSLPDWVAVVAMNETRSAARRRAAEHRARERLAALAATAPTAAPGADEGGGDGSAQLAGLLAPLPRRQREVAALHYVLDLDVAAVADNLGISVGAVKNALFHARANLRQSLGDQAARERTADQASDADAVEPSTERAEDGRRG